MDIALCIFELLQTQNQVGVIGLGSFYKKKLPGKYDTVKNAFIPPSITTAFTTEILEQESLLNYIIQTKNISPDSARYFIEEFAENAQAKLAENKALNLAPIGTLTRVNEEMSFSQNEEIDLNSAYFGFPELTETADSNESQAAANPEKTDTQPQALPEVEATETLTDHQEAEAENIKKENSFLTKLFIVLLSIIVLVAIAYLINPVFFNGLLNNNSPSKSDKVIKAQKTDSLAATGNNLALDTLSKPAALAIDTTAQLDSSKIILYEVIASAEKSQNRVNAFIAHMAKKGISVKALPKAPGKSMIKLSIGTFTDFNLAKKHQDSLRIKLNNPDIYIQQIKPKK